MESAERLSEHASLEVRSWAVGDVEVSVRTKVGVRGYPGLDGALVAAAPTLRRGRFVPRGRALDLSGAPAAFPVWSAAAGLDAAWTFATPSAAVWAAARALRPAADADGPPSAAGTGAAAGVGPGQGGSTLLAALPWEVAGPFDTIVWRPPADRGLRRVRAELAAVAAALAPDGQVLALQHKDEGAQRSERAAADWFDEVETVGREAGWRVTLLRGRRPDGAAPDPWTAFEVPDGPAHGPVRAVAGTFAAEKLDPGTAVLLRALDGAGAAAAAGARLLDLGCGTGLLARAALRSGAARVVAVDDDLGAVRSAAAQLDGDARAAVVHADLLWPRDPAEARHLPVGGFDVVWCNPPFHVGRQVVGALSMAFVAAAHQALRPGGEAWFVVNRALPYAAELARWSAYDDRTPPGERAFTVWRAVR